MGRRSGTTVFAALDLETTGTNPLHHRILEVGIVLFDRDRRELDAFSSLINPERDIPDEVIAIHGITETMVAGAPRFAELQSEMTGILSGAVPVMHNPAFDLSFLAMEGFNGGLIESLDTVRLARKALPGEPSFRLDSLARSLGLAPGSHRALGDARACRDLFCVILDRVDPTRRWSLGDIRSYHGRPVRSPLKRRQDGFWAERIAREESVTVSYLDSQGEITERVIRPLDHLRYGRKEYVRAFCRLRNEVRVFREDHLRVL